MNSSSVRNVTSKIVRKSRGVDAMLIAGKDLAAVLQALEVREATYHRRRDEVGGSG